MTTKPRATLQPLKLSLRQELAARFAEAIAGSTVIYEVLNQTDGVYTSQVVRVAFEMADSFLKVEA